MKLMHHLQSVFFAQLKTLQKSKSLGPGKIENISNIKMGVNRRFEIVKQ